MTETFFPKLFREARRGESNDRVPPKQTEESRKKVEGVRIETLAEENEK